MADDTYVRGLVLRMTQLIVSHPTVVVVESDRDADSVIFVVSVDPRDMASLGGNDGRIARSLNHIVGGIGGKVGQSMAVEIECRR
jgi:predicted RNA-binding protein YlqC (UPF0109 family)